jgi:eukaryotic-like serine/threonine-protein kinase
MRPSGLLTAVLAAATAVLAACTQQSAPRLGRAPSPSAPRAAGHSRVAHRTVGSHPAAAARPTARATVRHTPPPDAGPAACPNGAVTVSAVRGGALPGQEVALLVFTNRGDSACTLTGFPGVELLAHDSVVGRPAIRSALPVRTLRLTPGARVTARLSDNSRCNAPLSDTVGVYVPNQTVQLHTALQLRGCALTIDPVRS